MRLFLLPILVAGLATVSPIAGQPTATSSTTQNSTATRERREKAFAAMLEGQRYAWVCGRTRSQSVMVTNANLAKAAFLRAIEFDPTLAEAYTAVSELSVAIPPGDVPLGLELAAKAVKIDKDNIGAHRILARLNTLRSGVTASQFDLKFGNIAIAEWKEVTRLDPRNAEGWAFLSTLYQLTGMRDERIDALRKWLASTQPVEIGFFRNVIGPGEDLMPEAASIKLGAALVDSGKMNEAVEVLSMVVADAPDNSLGIELLGKALASADSKTSALALQSLQQAVYANPRNLVLAILLGKVQSRSGKFDDAILGLARKAKALEASDPVGSAVLLVAAGDIFATAGQVADAVEAYEKALETRGIGKVTLVETDEREFAIMVFGKIIQTYKTAKRTTDVLAVIERARRLLGRNDLFTKT